MKCERCQIEMKIKRAVAAENGERRPIYVCRNPDCEQYGREIELGLQPETAADK